MNAMRSVETTQDLSPADPILTGRTLLFATAPADARQTRVAGRALVVFFLCFFAAAPFARLDMPRVDAFLPLYASARVVIEALTAALLFALFRNVGARSVLVLGCGYLFSVLMAIAHTASFPGVLSPHGLLAAAGQSTTWLYFIWHGGFAITLLAYSFMTSEAPGAVVRRSRNELSLGLGVVVVAAIATVGYVSSSPLPDLMNGDADGPLKVYVAMLSWALNALAVASVYLRRPRRVLDLWVLMVAAGWLFDTGLAGLLNHARFDFGWYAGRVFGLLAAGFVLFMLLYEYIVLHRRLVHHYVSMGRTSFEQLQVALTTLSVAQRAANAGFWDWEIGTGKLTWSDELFQLFGLDAQKSEANFETWRGVVHPDDLSASEARITEALRRKAPLYNHYRIVRPDGTVRWIDAHGDVLLDASGQAMRMTGLCIDVTERVAADEALRESEGKLRLFIDHAPAALAMFDTAMCYVAASRRWLADYRLEGSIIGRSHYDVFPDVPERWKEIHRRALGGEVIGCEEDSFQRADGQQLWLRWEVRPWHRVSGSIGGIVAMSEDISERKRAQDALRDSESRFRLLMEQAPDGIFVLDASGRCTDINQAGATLFGFERSDLIGVSFRERLQVAPGGRGYDEVWAEARSESVTCEWRFLRRDGTDFIGEAVVRRLPDGGMQGIIRDVIARRRAERALRDSEYFYRQTLESIPGMVFTTRPDGYCDYQSQQWAEYTGVPVVEHRGDGWNALLHPEDRYAARVAWYDAVEGRAPYDLEYRVRRRDGVHEWFRVIGRPIRDAEGRIVRWFGVAVNIERLKQAEALLAQRGRELEAALDAMPAMVYMKDSQRRYIRVNNALTEMLGLPANRILGRPDEAFMPPELAEVARNSDLHVFGTKAPIRNLEESWHDDSGAEHWVSTSKSPLLHADGSIAGVVGVSIDITEHKQAEAMRLQALERQRDALVREVHHRIKNHLQGVIGLLRYRSAESERSSSRIELAIGQIASIAQVYGLQGRSHDTQLRLHELIESAIQGASAPVAFVRSPELADVVVPQSDAVPLALVINELITNATKHVSAEQSSRQKIAVHMESTGGSVSVEIRSGPARLPAGFDFQRRSGLGTGLELVTVLLPEQRYGLSIVQEGGDVVARLWFRAPDGKPRDGGVADGLPGETATPASVRPA